MRNLIGSSLFVAMLVLPLTAAADDHDHNKRDNQSQRYYDSNHKDYHQWNDQEQREYDRYLDENHRKHEDFGRTSKREQQNYWKWRHQHGDDH
jgi:hypothetical protein